MDHFPCGRTEGSAQPECSSLVLVTCCSESAVGSAALTITSMWSVDVDS